MFYLRECRLLLLKDRWYPLRETPASDCALSNLLQDDRDGVFVKWRVENSWGEDHGHKGELNLITLT